MFSGVADAGQKAGAIAASLADHGLFKSHGRFIDRQQARGLGLLIEDLEANANVEDATLGVFHATTHTFTGTAAVKLLENHRGKAFIKIEQQIMLRHGVGMPVPVPAPNQPTPQSTPPPPPAAP